MPVPAALAPVPSSLDLRADMTPVKRQGDRDTCAFFAVVAEIEAAMKRKLGRDVNLSEEYLVHRVTA